MVTLTNQDKIKHLKIINHSKNMQIIEEAEGAIALRKLQNNEMKFCSKEELETVLLKEARLSPKNLIKAKEIINYISRQNSFKAVPCNAEIKKRFNLNFNLHQLYKIRELDLAFNFTMPEMVGYYGLEYMGFKSHNFHPPDHLKWSKNYLLKINGAHGERLPWYKKIRPENCRHFSYEHYWVSTLKDENDLPYCLPLGLHIPKQ